MARKYQIDTPAVVAGLLEALNGLDVTGNQLVTGTLSVGSTAVITGKLTLTAGIAGALLLDTQASTTGHAVRADRTITAGDGLTGGGNLTANRSFAVSFGGTGAAITAARSDHNHDTTYLGIAASAADSLKLGGVVASSFVQASLTLTAGAGLTGGGTLAANRTFAVVFAGTGSADTAARSDHNHNATYFPLTGGTITGGLTIQNTNPSYTWIEDGVTADNKRWDIIADVEQLKFRTVNDANSVAVNYMTVDRTGTAIDKVEFFGPVTVPSNLTVKAVDGTSEGGEITLKGAGANADIALDNYAGTLRSNGSKVLTASDLGDMDVLYWMGV